MFFFFFLTNQGRLAPWRNKERLSIDPYFQYHLSQRLDRFEKLSNQGRLALSRNKERLSIDPDFQYHFSRRLDGFEKAINRYNG